MSAIPELFREKWQKRYGYDVVDTKAKVNFWSRMVQINCIVSLLVVILYVLYHHTKHIQLDPIIFFVVGILWYGVTMYVATLCGRYNKRISDFNVELGAVAASLGRSPEDLATLDEASVKNLADKFLKEIVPAIRILDSVEGNGAQMVKESVKAQLKNHHTRFVEWGLVPDSGWQQYFK